MGGLFFCIHNFTNSPIDITFTKGFINMKNRGPDDTQLIYDQTPILNNLNINQIKMNLSRKEIYEYKPLYFTYGFHRSSINDLTISGSQPFEDPLIWKISKYPELRQRPKRRLLCNGEIYNYTDLLTKYNFNDKDLQSNSDVEIILPLYINQTSDIPQENLKKTIDELDGEFSFILTENTSTYDLKALNVFAVRDLFGTRPLYMVKYLPSNSSKNKDNILYLFTSEIKSIPLKLLNDPEYIIQEVPPGTYWSYNNSVINKSETEFINYYNLDKYKTLDSCIINKADPNTISLIYDTIKTTLTNSIISKWKLTERNIGLLLSGGFDSCIILSILCKYLINLNEIKSLHVFTIGNDNSSDVIFAKKHVEFLENRFSIDIHHHIINVCDLNIIIPEIDDTINCLETFDKLTIHKSIPLLFLLKYIKENTDVKVLLSGEGLDELCGYEEFNNLNDSEFQHKSVELISNLHKYDLLRSDKIAGKFGLEIRYPFLNKEFIEFILSIHPKLKRPQIYGFSKDPIEKYIIRKAFDYMDDQDANNISLYIDKDVLWNSRKDINNCFSNLNTYLHDYYESKYTDIVFFDYTQRLKSINFNSLPKTKEEMYYQIIFNNYFPNSRNLVNKFWKDLW
jgi:asparagine synthase (glutamine-hydrolysing)